MRMSYKVSEDYRGVIYIGQEKFGAGDAIPDEAAKKIDLKSLMNDGTVIKGGKDDSGSGDGKQGLKLDKLKLEELLEIARELKIEVPEKPSKKDVIKLIEETKPE
jgi:hypothetical protein